MTLDTSTITKETRVSLGLLLTVGLTVAGLIYNYSSAKTELGYQQAQIAELKATVKVLEDKQAASDVRMQRGEDGYAHILDSLGELKGEVRSMQAALSAPVVHPVRGH